MEANKLQQLKELIEERPKVFGWLKVQQVLFWIFLILGSILFAITLYQLIWNALESIFIDDMIREIGEDSELYGQEEFISKVLKKYFLLFGYRTIFNHFIISLLFFVAARYTQKVMRRNKYILAMEEIIIQ